MTEELPSNKFHFISCPICNFSKLGLYLEITYGQLKQKPSLDYSPIGVGKDTVLTVRRCKSCNFFFVNPRVKPEYEPLIYNECKKSQKKHLVAYRKWIQLFFHPRGQAFNTSSRTFLKYFSKVRHWRLPTDFVYSFRIFVLYNSSKNMDIR